MQEEYGRAFRTKLLEISRYLAAATIVLAMAAPIAGESSTLGESFCTLPIPTCQVGSPSLDGWDDDLGMCTSGYFGCSGFAF